MKKFNSVITVEVQVDAIAEHLLEIIYPAFLHREALVETIITSALETKSLGLIYNSLNGYSNKPMIEIGARLYCTDTIASYDDTIIGECTVVEINEARTDGAIVKIEFVTSIKKATKWVNPNTLFSRKPIDVMENPVAFPKRKS